LHLLFAGCILAVVAHRQSHAAGAGADSLRSTRTGAYTEVQAGRGKELYTLNCVSCHTAITHTGPAFVDKWEGRLLWELYQFLSESMPKSEPGSLTPGEYSRVLAYMLQMNGAPAGPVELLPDSTALKLIRIELKPR